jgi:subtilisin family serine protease
VSIGADGTPLTLGGTSAATALVSGAIALLWSAFPAARASEVKWAVTGQPRNRLVPPLLDAWRSHQKLSAVHAERKVS